MRTLEYCANDKQSIQPEKKGKGEEGASFVSYRALLEYFVKNTILNKWPYSLRENFYG
jgi:hypothetical protein